MKLAIFLEQKLRPSGRKSNSHSRIPGISPSRPPSALSHSVPWALDDMVQAYLSHGSLPLPLLPLLPPSFEKADSKSVPWNLPLAVDDDVPMLLLLPTLPTMFDDQGERPGSERKKTAVKKTERSEKAERVDKSDKVEKLEKHDKDGKPEKHEKHEKHDADAAKQEADKADKPEKPPVRWINRLNEDRPRFLLRITFRSPRYHATFDAAKVVGLGILQSRDVLVPPPPLLPLVALVALADNTIAAAAACAHSGGDWAQLADECRTLGAKAGRYGQNGAGSELLRAGVACLASVAHILAAAAAKREIAVLKAAPSPRYRQICELYTEIEAQFLIAEGLVERSAAFGGPRELFPKTWRRSGSFLSKPVSSPATDDFHLPLGIFSDVRDVCAVLYGYLREFVEQHSGQVRYTLHSGSRKS